jgi:hypothetical protein
MSNRSGPGVLGASAAYQLLPKHGDLFELFRGQPDRIEIALKQLIQCTRGRTHAQSRLRGCASRHAFGAKSSDAQRRPRRFCLKASRSWYFETDHRDSRGDAALCGTFEVCDNPCLPRAGAIGLPIARGAIHKIRKQPVAKIDLGRTRAGVATCHFVPGAM